MQGVIKSYDPGTGDGVLVSELDLTDIDLAADALDALGEHEAAERDRDRARALDAVDYSRPSSNDVLLAL